jgi:catechol 2,3-dioxygenase-like lactoylglutathione lyase family enzyme
VELGISVLKLGVRDVERAIRFYRDGLGLPLRSADDGILACFELGEICLALCPRERLAADVAAPSAGEGFCGFTLAHHVRSPKEVCQLARAAEEAGARVVQEPHHTGRGGFAACFADPDGFFWQVAWDPQSIT